MAPFSSSSSPSSSVAASPLWSPSSSYHSSTRTTPISSAHGSSAGLSGMTMSTLPGEKAPVGSLGERADSEEGGYVVEGAMERVGSPASDSGSPPLPWASSEWDEQAFSSILGGTKGIGLGLGTDICMGEGASQLRTASEETLFHRSHELDPGSDTTDVCSPISNARSSSLRWPSTSSRPPMYSRDLSASTSLLSSDARASATYRRTSRILSFATEYDYDGQPSSTTLHGSHTEQTWSADAERSWRHSLPSRNAPASSASTHRSSPSVGSNASSSGPSPVLPQGIPTTPLRASTRAARAPSSQSAPTSRHGSRAPSRTNSSANLHGAKASHDAPSRAAPTSSRHLLGHVLCENSFPDDPRSARSIGPRSRRAAKEYEFPFPSSPAQDESYVGGTINHSASKARAMRSSLPPFASPPARSSSRFYDHSDASSATQTPQPNSSSDFTRAAGTSSSAASTPRVRAQSAFETSRAGCDSFRTRPSEDFLHRSSFIHAKHAGASQRPHGDHKRTWSTFGYSTAPRTPQRPRPHRHSTVHTLSGHLAPTIPAIQGLGKSDLVVSARRYAQNLTVPLKPMAQAVVLVTVSSAAVIGFLVLLAVSYALTAMDDFEKRVKGVNDAAFVARKSASSSVERGKYVLEQAKISAIGACTKAVNAGIQAVADRTAEVRDRVIGLAGPAAKPAAEPISSQATTASVRKRVRRHRRKAGVPFRPSRPSSAVEASPAQQYLSDADDPDTAEPRHVRSTRPSSAGNGSGRGKRISPRGSPPKTGSTISLPESITDASSAADDEDGSSDSDDELQRSPISHALPYFGFAYRSSAAPPCWTSATGCEPSTSKAASQTPKQADHAPSSPSAPSATKNSGPARPPLSILLPSLVVMIMIAVLSAMFSMCAQWLERDVPRRSWRNWLFGNNKGKGRA